MMQRVAGAYGRPAQRRTNGYNTDSMLMGATGFSFSFGVYALVFSYSLEYALLWRKLVRKPCVTALSRSTSGLMLYVFYFGIVFGIGWLVAGYFFARALMRNAKANRYRNMRPQTNYQNTYGRPSYGQTRPTSTTYTATPKYTTPARSTTGANLTSSLRRSRIAGRYPAYPPEANNAFGGAKTPLGSVTPSAGSVLPVPSPYNATPANSVTQRFAQKRLAMPPMSPFRPVVVSTTPQGPGLRKTNEQASNWDQQGHYMLPRKHENVNNIHTTPGAKAFDISTMPMAPGGAVLTSTVSSNEVSDLYVSLGIIDFMPVWQGRMRLWLSQMIFKPLTKWMDVIEKKFQAPMHAISQSLRPLPPQPLENRSNNTRNALWALRPVVKPAEDSPDSVMHKMAHLISECLNVLGATSHQYVAQRIKDLSEGSCLSCYDWRGGGSSGGYPWTPELPTDAQIVMHVFEEFMNQMLETDPNQPDEQHRFTTDHFIFPNPSEEELRPRNKDVEHRLAIYQTHIHPPHFELMNGHELWHVPEGRNNLFQALSLFTYQVVKKYKGYLNLVDFANPAIKLAAVVAETTDPELIATSGMQIWKNIFTRYAHVPRNPNLNMQNFNFAGVTHGAQINPNASGDWSKQSIRSRVTF